MILSNIGDMRIGIVFSRKIKEKGQDENYIYKAITLASVNTDGTIDISKLEHYPAAKPVNDNE